jgi:hypothetical protein
MGLDCFSSALVRIVHTYFQSTSGWGKCSQGITENVRLMERVVHTEKAQAECDMGT